MRVKEIDFLRLIAAIFVMCFHYFWYYPSNFDNALFSQINPVLSNISRYGSLGVPLFFMISGFVIMNSANRYLLREFIWSRFLRIYPTLFICATITFIVICIYGSPYHREYSIFTYLSNLTLLHRFIFNQNHLDGSYWTLVVEIRFYALIGFLMFLNKCREDNVFIILLLWSLLALFNAFRGHDGNFISSGPYFLSGVLFYYQYSFEKTASRWFKLLFSMLVCMLVIFFEKHSLHVQLVSVCAVFVFHLVFFLILFKKLTLPINDKFMLLCGGITYPFYLLHQHIGYVLFNNFSSLNFSVVAVLIIGVTFSLAILITKYFEHQFLSKIRRKILAVQ